MSDEKIYRDGAPIDCNSAGVPAEIKPREFWTNAPGHKHAVIGIWDSDNGAKAGTVCDLCLRWNEYEKLKAENERLEKRIENSVEFIEWIENATNHKLERQVYCLSKERDELKAECERLRAWFVRKPRIFTSDNKFVIELVNEETGKLLYLEIHPDSFLLKERDELRSALTEAKAALETLVLDVQDYDAWARPCYALDKAKAALEKLNKQNKGE